MRADRLLSILILLQSRGKMTAKELADELEVSVRTIHRDMDALTYAGIPVIAERGKNGGWRLYDRFRSRLSGLTLDEIKSLFLTPAEDVMADLGMAHPSLDPRQKFLAMLPEAYRSEAQTIWECIYIDSGTWRPSKEKANSFKTVQQAIWEQRKLRIIYEQGNGKRKVRLVAPLGLVAMGNKWYLVALRDGEYRNYRVSRIRHAQVENETFKRPADFHLATYWEQSKAAFIQNLPKYDVRVEIHPSIISRITFTDKFVKVIQKEEVRPKGWVPATLRFDHEQEAISYLLGFADKIKVLSPCDLPKKIVAQARAVIHFYQKISEDFGAQQE